MMLDPPESGLSKNITRPAMRLKPSQGKAGSGELKDTTVHPRASKMLAEDKVQTRLHELQAEAREKHNVTIESLTIELEEARNLAKQEGQASAAVSATMGKAKLHGLVVDKNELTRQRRRPARPCAQYLSREKNRNSSMTGESEDAHGQRGLPAGRGDRLCLLPDRERDLETGQAQRSIV